jgi:hypothetical protein
MTASQEHVSGGGGIDAARSRTLTAAPAGA